VVDVPSRDGALGVIGVSGMADLTYRISISENNINLQNAASGFDKLKGGAVESDISSLIYDIW
jgi:hypothetical protein